MSVCVDTLRFVRLALSTHEERGGREAERERAALWNLLVLGGAVVAENTHVAVCVCARTRFAPCDCVSGRVYERRYISECLHGSVCMCLEYRFVC